MHDFKFDTKLYISSIIKIMLTFWHMKLVLLVLAYFDPKKYTLKPIFLFHTSSVERFNEIVDQKAVTYLIFFVGTH